MKCLLRCLPWLLAGMMTAPAWGFDLLDDEEGAPAEKTGPHIIEFRYDGKLPEGQWQRFILPQLRRSADCPALLALLRDDRRGVVAGLCLRDASPRFVTVPEAEAHLLPQQHSRRRDGDQRVEVLYNTRGTPAFILLWYPKTFTRSQLKGHGVYIQDTPQNIAEALPGQLMLAGEPEKVPAQLLAETAPQESRRPPAAHGAARPTTVAEKPAAATRSRVSRKAAPPSRHAPARAQVARSSATGQAGIAAVATETLPSASLPDLGKVHSLAGLARALEKAPREKLPHSFEHKVLTYLIYFGEQLRRDCTPADAAKDIHCPAYYVRFFPHWKHQGHIAFLRDLADFLHSRDTDHQQALIERWKKRPVLQQVLRDNQLAQKLWAMYDEAITFRPGEDRAADLQEMNRVIALLPDIRRPNLLVKGRRNRYEEVKKYAPRMKHHLEEVVADQNREQQLKALGERIMGRRCEEVEWWGGKKNGWPEGEVTLYCEEGLSHGGELVIGTDLVIHDRRVEDRSGKVWAYARRPGFLGGGKDTTTREATYRMLKEIPARVKQVVGRAKEDWQWLVEGEQRRAAGRPASVSLYRCREADGRRICEVRSDLGEEGTLFARWDGGEQAYHLDLMGSPHAQTVTGTYFTRNRLLTTTACGRRNGVASVDVAMRLFARCALLRHF